MTFAAETEKNNSKNCLWQKYKLKHKTEWHEYLAFITFALVYFSLPLVTTLWENS